MKHSLQPARRWRTWPAIAALALLGACGGGGDGDDQVPPPSSCTVADNKQWLLDYFQGNALTGQQPWYFWYALSPLPNPAAFGTEDAYFRALLYTGTNASFPADRWSGYQSTASFNSFFGDGQVLGYGLFVAGLEVQGQPTQPLYIRYVEPLSPAAAAGVVRGDRIVSVNGRTSADLIGTDGFGVLTPQAQGETISLVLANTLGQQRVVVLNAQVYALSPVTGARVVSTPQNRRMGYLHVKDMISQASPGLANAFALFRAQGVTELAIDLRYNGGGLVSTGAEIGSYVAAASDVGSVFSTLLYNDRQSGNNRNYLYTSQPNALGLNRVFVLAGPRTCSASEQLVNGLRGIGIQVVMIGDTTCGKPVGFLPQDNGCGTTYSVVNFESVNALNQGRYFDGFAACPVAEDFSRPLGDVTEPLLNAARLVADGSACAATSGAARERVQSLRDRGVRQPIFSDGERPAMIPR